MDITEVRTALKDAINGIRGLEVTDLCDEPNVPCAIVFPDVPFVYDATFTANQKPTFIVMLLVAYNDVIDAQQNMDRYLSTEGEFSIKAAIERDPKLGGLVDSAEVIELRSYDVIQLHDGGRRYLHADLAVEIWA